MRRAHHVIGLTALAAASLTLTGCEKPAPGITVFTGTQSVRTEALCWAFDADQLSPGACAADILQGQTTSGVERLTATPGNVVGVSVDPAVAQAGWNIVIGGQKLSETPMTETYFRFSLPDLPGQLGTEPVPLQVVAGQDTKIRGVWIVALQPNGE